ncbi:MAG: hypothetical protein ACR2NX_09795 [Chthoniobacterales bacterium]
MRSKLTIIALALALGLSPAFAQTPAPIVIQAATGAPPAAAPRPQVSVSSPSTNAALQIVQELKAKNEELLQKQAATLQRLDELEKAAEQMKIYSKRG